MVTQKPKSVNVGESTSLWFEVILLKSSRDDNIVIDSKKLRARPCRDTAMLRPVRPWNHCPNHKETEA